jgi:hypothetical protein
VFLLWLVSSQGQVYMYTQTCRAHDQGATVLYRGYIYPYILDHESEIETLICTGHHRLKCIGIASLRRIWATLEENMTPPRWLNTFILKLIT